MKKTFLTLFALLLALLLTGTALAEESPDGLHASIQHTADSPAWVKSLPSAQDEKVTQPKHPKISHTHRIRIRRTNKVCRY